MSYECGNTYSGLRVHRIGSMLVSSDYAPSADGSVLAFDVAVGHQFREDAIPNGCSVFLPGDVPHGVSHTAFNELPCGVMHTQPPNTLLVYTHDLTLRCKKIRQPDTPHFQLFSTRSGLAPAEYFDHVTSPTYYQFPGDQKAETEFIDEDTPDLPDDLVGCKDIRVRHLYQLLLNGYPFVHGYQRIFFNDAITWIGEHKPTFSDILKQKRRAYLLYKSLKRMPLLKGTTCLTFLGDALDCLENGLGIAHPEDDADESLPAP